MKFLIASLLLLASAPAHALVSPAVYSEIIFNGANLATDSFSLLYPQLPKAVKEVQFWNSSPNPILVAIAPSTSTINTGQEVVQAVIAPGGGVSGFNAAVNPFSVRLPISLSQGLRIAIKSEYSTVKQGTLQANFLFY